RDETGRAARCRRCLRQDRRGRAPGRKGRSNLKWRSISAREEYRRTPSYSPVSSRPVILNEVKARFFALLSRCLRPQRKNQVLRCAQDDNRLLLSSRPAANTSLTTSSRSAGAARWFTTQILSANRPSMVAFERNTRPRRT